MRSIACPADQAFCIPLTRSVLNAMLSLLDVLAGCHVLPEKQQRTVQYSSVPCICPDPATIDALFKGCGSDSQV